MLKSTYTNVFVIFWINFHLPVIVSAGFFEKRHVLITEFKYQMCNPDINTKDGIWVPEADIMTTAYGDLDVWGTVIVYRNLTSPIKASVSLRRKISGIYVPLPCIQEFGSCTYDDLCSYGYPIEKDCPSILEENDIPCRCSIKTGVYTLRSGQFQIPETRLAGLLAGQYKGLVKLCMNNQQLACYKFYFTVE